MKHLNIVLLFFFLGLTACVPKNEAESNTDLAAEVKKE